MGAFGVAVLVAVLVLSNARATCGSLGEPDARRVAEVQDVLHRYGAAVWPGWGGPTPVLLRSGACEYLVDHPAPPAGFVPVEQDRGDAPRLFAMVGHLTPGPVATTWPVAGVWTIALPTLDEFQVAVDAALGPGVLTLDDASYVRAALHEAFHAFQLRSVGGLDGVPRFGLLDERTTWSELEGDADHQAWVVAQAVPLSRALSAATVEEATAEVRAFLDQRSVGRSEQVAAFGHALEWLEGTARYADTRITALAWRSGVDATRTDVSPDQRALADVLSQLDELHSFTVRDAYATLGAAQAFVLDRLSPGWKRLVLAERQSLEALLSDAVAP